MRMIARRSGLPVLAILFFSGVLRGSTKPLFDEKANAHHDISVASANATKTRKNVVLVFGANW